MPLNLLADQLRARLPVRATEDPGTPRAAVAAVFRPGPDLLFIQRSERQGDPWSGHMAFPGGRASPEDPSGRHTAERECLEEVGLDLGVHGEVIGQLDELAAPVRRSSRPPLVIETWVYGLAHDPVLRPNHEVARVFWFSLERLRAGEGRGTLLYDYEGTTLELPCVRLDGTLIWGLTLRLVDDLLGHLAAAGWEGLPPAP